MAIASTTIAAQVAVHVADISAARERNACSRFVVHLGAQQFALSMPPRTRMCVHDCWYVPGGLR